MAESSPQEGRITPSQEQNDQENGLHTVELNSEDQVPVLSFHEDNTDEDTTNPPVPSSTNTVSAHTGPPSNAGATAGVTTTNNNNNTNAFVEGTVLQGRPPVTKTIATGTQNLKEWSFQQFKVTKQLFSERMGKSLRTVDASLESRLEAIKDTQRKYQQLMSLSGQLQLHLQRVVDTQRALAEHFAFLSVRSPELDIEFEFNSETQKRIARNGDTLVASIKFFISNVYTVSSKSIEDTLQTAKQYETSRVLYDAYRSDLENITKAAKNSQAAANKLPSVTADYERQKGEYEKLRYNLDIKIKLLDENRFKVIQRQLLVLHSAFAAYFSGNHVLMEQLVKDFQEKLEAKGRDRGTDPPAWLEELPADDQSLEIEQ